MQCIMTTHLAYQRTATRGAYSYYYLFGKKNNIYIGNPLPRLGFVFILITGILTDFDTFADYFVVAFDYYRLFRGKGGGNRPKAPVLDSSALA